MRQCNKIRDLAVSVGMFRCKLGPAGPLDGVQEAQNLRPFSLKYRMAPGWNGIGEAVVVWLASSIFALSEIKEIVPPRLRYAHDHSVEAEDDYAPETPGAHA